jgi:hypothetical protein
MRWRWIVLTVAKVKFLVTMAVPRDDTMQFGRQVSAIFKKTAAPNFRVTLKMEAQSSSKMLVCT